MKIDKQKNGFILLFVVALIPLIGMVLAILTTNSKTLAVQTRREFLQMEAQNACWSGLAWASHNRRTIKSMQSEKPLLLPIGNGTRKVYCRIEHVQNTVTSTVIQITGHAEDNRFSADYKVRKALPSNP